MDKIKQFFTNKDGRVVLGQPPNAPILLWFGLMVAAMLTSGEFSAQLQLLSRMFLFVWAYLEITSGDSPFRQVLGGVVAGYLVINLFY